MDKLEQAFKKLSQACDKCGTNRVWEVSNSGVQESINRCETCLDRELGLKNTPLSKSDKQGLHRLQHYLGDTVKTI
jgi:DNA replicative helicase MCM subunit Mcm2 (Cdc46/Mcm family)